MSSLSEHICMKTQSPDKKFIKPRFEFLRACDLKSRKKIKSKARERKREVAIVKSSRFRCFFFSAGIFHWGEPVAAGEARIGIVCASANRHSLKA